MSKLKRCLEQIVGPENVSDDDFETVCYSRGWSVEGPYPPLIIVKPQKKEQVVEIMGLANRMRVPISPYGGNSELVGSHAKNAIGLDMTRMRGVIKIDEDSLTVTALAGTTWEELFYLLNRKGWTTGPHLHSAPSATLGGGVALCANGATGAKYGLVGHQVVGLEVVLPNCDLLRTGSGAHPACKQFIRYAWGSDLTGLFIGSHGIFGVITEVTMNIYPLPEAEVICGFEYEKLESAVNALYQVQKSRIPIEYASILMPETMKFWSNIRGNSAIIPIVITGTNKEVEIWKKQVEEICLKEGEKVDETAIETATKEWKRIYYAPDWRAWASEWEGCSMQISLCNAIPTPDSIKLYHAFNNLCKEEKINDYRIVAYSSIFASSPNCVNASQNIVYDERDQNSWQKAAELARKTTVLMTELGQVPSYMGRLKGMPEVMWRLGSYIELIRTIKRAVDPNNIMNPGQLMTPTF